MLVLSRKAGETINIGDQIVLVVKRVSGHRVTIGIQAPHGLHILRGELEVEAAPAQPAPAPAAPAPTEPAVPRRRGHSHRRLSAARPR